ncbi:hypothetical protein Lalb_Chr10g0103491 [Lupinus albus]|uniref:Uncharacterized protein n=1 Tax=Lupinus albus TaxID=3870 RepID=A0A6A4PX39_LUPAL|nr:hypothetical protein Lalb_Chr10g0103491 [Lupinus albus]
MENRINPNGVPAVAFTRNMIEKIENPYTYLLAVSLVPKYSYFVVKFSTFYRTMATIHFWTDKIMFKIKGYPSVT